MELIEFVRAYSSSILSGTIVTVQLFICSSVLALIIAALAGLAKANGPFFVRWPAIVYIEIFRGTSLLVQLYWIFFVLPLFGVSLPQFTAGVISIGLNCGAYGAELVRAAIQAVPKGQSEAGIALSMTGAQRMRRIIFPQAFVQMLPPWGNLLIELLKGTALVSLISVSDLMFEARQINSATYLSAQAFGYALLVYYILARCGITPLMRVLERAAQRKLGKI